jgi:hypothetical protein
MGLTGQAGAVWSEKGKSGVVGVEHREAGSELHLGLLAAANVGAIVELSWQPSGLFYGSVGGCGAGLS